MKVYSYLALGDSYTIGEKVPLTESFPYQTVQLLRKALSAHSHIDDRLHFMPPEIIAATGFTTDELIDAIDKLALLPAYDFVTLLIGVNNQYRGWPVATFETEFEQLLQRAIRFAGGNPGCVYVLSIPDWGVTPFANDRDSTKIATAIDAFNLVCLQLSAKFQTQFIDITVSQRIDGDSDEFLATDQLHPSGKEYTKWATLLSEKMLHCIT